MQGISPSYGEKSPSAGFPGRSRMVLLILPKDLKTKNFQDKAAACFASTQKNMVA